MSTPNDNAVKDCSYCGEYHPQHGAICPRYEEHKAEDAQDAKPAQPQPPQGERIPAHWHDCKVAERQILKLQQQRSALRQQRDELLADMRKIAKTYLADAHRIADAAIARATEGGQP